MRIQRNSELAWREVGGETIVIHLGRKMMYGLSPAGGRIWAALDGGATMEELERLVPAEAGEQDSVRGAVRAFLADLAAEDLITIEGSAPEGGGESGGITGAHLPVIGWREEVRRFAGASCALTPAEAVTCGQAPFTQ